MKNIVEKDTLNELYEELLKCIKNRSNPFDTPIIVFPNLKLQHWFRAKWLSDNDTVLMNINYERLDDIVWKLLNTNGSIQLRNDEIRDMLINLLSSDLVDGIEDFENAKNYYVTDGEINPIKLYDLASSLSKLFLEYEEDDFSCFSWQSSLFDLLKNEAKSKNKYTLRMLLDECENPNTENSVIHVFGFTSITKLMNDCLNKISNNNHVIFYEQNKVTNSLPEIATDLKCSPSKLREVEILHSKICSIIRDTEAKFSDFLVVAPSISDYENEIVRVFHQDNKEFPNLPFSINDKAKVDGDLSLALKCLFSIKNKNFFTRLDFVNLVKNRLISKVRNISDEEIDVFVETILAMNVYRNSEVIDDWEYAKKRLILSKVSDLNQLDNEIIELNDSAHKPYSSIGMNDETIIKFVNAIDDLQSWLKTFKSLSVITKDSISLIRNELSKWFSIADDDGFETCNGFKKLIKVLDSWNEEVSKSEKVPLNTLFYALLDASMSSRFNCGEAFSSGITFIDIDVKSLISAKYVFLLGASSDNIPHIYVKSELDQRTDDPKKEEKEIEALYYLHRNTKEQFNISFVSKDLQTDEDFFPSTFVLDLFGWSNLDADSLEKELKTRMVSIDENRDVEELFTRKEFKYADYYESLFKGGLKKPDDFTPVYEQPKKVSTSVLAEFLKEPLKQKATALFGSPDETNDELNDEYEPFTLSSLDAAGISKEIAKVVLARKSIINIETDLSIIEDLAASYSLEHRLPSINDAVKKLQVLDCIAMANDCFELVNSKTGGNYRIVEPYENSYVTDGQQWILSLNLPYVISEDDNTNERKYFEIKKQASSKAEKMVSLSEFMKLYIYSLMDVSKIEGETEYKIFLFRNSSGLSCTFKLTPAQANEKLSQIYKALNDYSENSYLPVDVFFNDKIGTLDTLIENTEDDYGPWGLFDDSNMFDKTTQLGYTYGNFGTKFKALMDKALDLLLFIDKNDEGGKDDD